MYVLTQSYVKSVLAFVHHRCSPMRRQYVHTVNTHHDTPLLHIHSDCRIKKESVDGGDERFRDLGLEND